jgi:hypothetical protein
MTNQLEIIKVDNKINQYQTHLLTMIIIKIKKFNLEFKMSLKQIFK